MEARQRLERLLVQIRSPALQPDDGRVHWKTGRRRTPGLGREWRRVYDGWFISAFRCKRQSYEHGVLQLRRDQVQVGTVNTDADSSVVRRDPYDRKEFARLIAQSPALNQDLPGSCVSLVRFQPPEPRRRLRDGARIGTRSQAQLLRHIDVIGGTGRGTGLSAGCSPSPHGSSARGPAGANDLKRDQRYAPTSIATATCSPSASGGALCRPP